jgi:hypothetical protein
MAKLYAKDPNAVLDYVVDWSEWLAASETISTSTFTVAAGITKDSESNTTTTAKVWLSGGTIGTTYRISNRITTNQSRTDDRSFDIRVEER